MVITDDVDERFLIRIVPKGQEDAFYLYPVQLCLPPRYNKHGGPTKLNILDLTGAGKRFLQPDLVCTGGVLEIDAQTGDIMVSHAEANKDIRVAEGTYDGVVISTLPELVCAGWGSRTNQRPTVRDQDGQGRPHHHRRPTEDVGPQG